MFSLQIVMSVLTIVAVCFAGCLLQSMRIARQRIAGLETEADVLRASVQSLESHAQLSAEAVRTFTAQVDNLLIRQAHVERGSSRGTYDDAIDLSRHGADTRELESACGVSLGEARLIKTLYGDSGDNTAVA